MDEKNQIDGNPPDGNPPKKKSINLALNPLIFLVCIVVVCAIASYIVPAGAFERVLNDATGRNVVVPGSFHLVDQNPTGLFSLLMSLTLGLQRAAYIIFFLFIIGGTFAILNATGAINAGMANIVRAMKGRELLLIPVCMVVFGCGSAFAANWEEYLVFVPLILAICLTIGFDSLTAVGIIFCSAASGYAGAITNAFTTGVAQGIAGLPIFSGMELRVALFITLMVVSISYVMWHAYRVRKKPVLSPTYELDKETAKTISLDVDSIPPLTGRQKIVLVIFIGGIAFTVWGVITQGYYIDELAAIFLTIGILAGIVGGIKPSKMCSEFVAGSKDMMFPVMMIGLANAMIVIMTEASIMDPVVNALAGLLNGLPPLMAACGMFVIQTIINIFINSGSGQAAVTMPIMAPLADVLGLTRQTAVLAFQMGDAFTNVLSPTAGSLLAALGMCGISFGKWTKYLIPLFVAWILIGFVFMIIAVNIHYGPF